ncbi:MAG TPA: HAD-IC family P-type ATPase, partial [Terrimesophilobacter sp.]|nr:HAD-IC family P-type ATPase [Terrimesophilobacter sp.]
MPLPSATPHRLVTRTPWHALTAEDALERLDTSASGLTTVDAVDRRNEFGPNSIPVAPPTPWWRTLLQQFASPLIAILIVAAAITASQQHWVDTVAIALALVFNAAIGFWQSRKAERDVRALQSLESSVARVRRDGMTRVMGAEELVPGDIVAMESGDKVPADVRLIHVNRLRVDESMLTGESLAAVKSLDAVEADAALGDRGCVAFSGTLVTSGRGRGVVIATGANTELGVISDLASAKPPPTPLQVLTHRLERWIGIIVLAIIAVIFVVGLFAGYTLSEMFRASVALAVATIPESLPIILTVAMSVGVSRMARRGAIVRTLPAVETLGSTTVIASDKTGTLTQNRLTVEQLWSQNGFLPADHRLDEFTSAILRAGALTNESVLGDDGHHHGDAVDVALSELAQSSGAVTEAERSIRPLAHTPYEPALRYSQTVRRAADGTPVLYVKGSPEVLAEMSTGLAGAGAWDPRSVSEANAMMARDGLRVLAFGTRELTEEEAAVRPLPTPSGLSFLG